MSTSSRRARENANVVAEERTEHDDDASASVATESDAAGATDSASGRHRRSRRSSSGINPTAATGRTRRASDTAPATPETGERDSGSHRKPTARRPSQGSGDDKRPTPPARRSRGVAQPRTWTCASCGGETDVRESMARCSHCGAIQWASYLLLPLLGALFLVATLIAVPALRESFPVVASVAKWAGLVVGTFVSWIGWYILVLDLTKDRIVLVWLITLVLGTLAVLIARFL